VCRASYPQGIEALLDLVSYAPEGFDTHAEVLHDDGRGASSLSAAGEGSERHNVGAVPSPENLQRLARLLEAGTLRVPIQRTYELDQAPDALRTLASDHTQGKRRLLDQASSTLRHLPKPGHIGQTVNARGFAYATCSTLQPLLAYG
jgi:hypothetical protein